MSARTDLCGGYQATGIPTATTGERILETLGRVWVRGLPGLKIEGWGTRKRSLFARNRGRGFAEFETEAGASGRVVNYMLPSARPAATCGGAGRALFARGRFVGSEV